MTTYHEINGREYPTALDTVTQARQMQATRTLRRVARVCYIIAALVAVAAMVVWSLPK